jgi:hypothetical protein
LKENNLINNNNNNLKENKEILSIKRFLREKHNLNNNKNKNIIK